MDSYKSIPDVADSIYSRYEQMMAFAWAQAHLSDFMRTHPSCTLDEKEKEFLDALEGGLCLALKLRQQHG